MALKRYRAVRLRGHYGVIDHGDPVQDAEGNVVTVTIGPGQEGAGEQVPLYQQDGDPEAPDTTTTVVFRTPGLSPDDKAAAHARAAELNEGG